MTMVSGTIVMGFQRWKLMEEGSNNKLMSHIDQGGVGALKETRTVRIHQEFIEIQGSPGCSLEKVDEKLV